MVNETKYGVISDTHREPALVPKSVDLLLGEGIDSFILNGDVINPGTYTDDLFWNSGCLDDGQCGILTVNEGGLVKYENIVL